MNDELVTAAVFGDHTQAVVVRNSLEEEGIPAFLVGEWMSQGLFVVGGASRGIRIQVPGSRLEEAIRLINERFPDHSAVVDWSNVGVVLPEELAVVEEEGEEEIRPNPTPPIVESTHEIEPGSAGFRTA